MTLIVWRHIGTHLSVTTDIVGGTTFNDFDTYRYIYRLYDIVLVLPAATILAYLLMAKFGPLRSAPRHGEWPPLLEETEDDSEPGTRLGSDVAEDGAPLWWMAGVWALVRVALVAVTVGIEANVAHSDQLHVLTWFGIGAGCLYALIVVATAMALGRRRASSMSKRGAEGNDRGRFARSLSSDLPVVNAFASIIVIPLLVLVSSSTSVTVASDGHVTRYPWFPAWFGALAIAVAVLLLVRAFRRAPTSRSRLMIERWTLLIVVVPIFIFMITAGIQGAQGGFNGFDDAQAMVGAKLLFWQGLWPWRDAYLLHGFFADALYGAVGMWVFSPTRWASNSGQTLFVVPFTIVALYGFIVYFARKNMLLVAAGTLALVLGFLSSWWDTRYVLIPVVLILFDRILRKGSWNRCLLFMTGVVFLSIVTPEATLLMIGVLATLVVAEAIHRLRRQPLREGFSRTIRCAVTGAACVGVWVIFLAASGTLSGFVEYYETAAVGHELWGAFTPQFTLWGNPWATVEFVLPIVLYLMTVWKVVSKLVRRAPWRTVEWVLVASSTPVLLFYMVALDRMDYGHVMEVFQTLVPFVLLWAMEIVRFADAKAAQVWAWLARRWSPATRVRLAVPVTLIAVVAIAVGSPTTAAAWKNVPGSFHAEVPVEAPRNVPLGYTVPGAVDVAQVEDLGKVLDRYAGKNGPVFDFVNEMGVTAFLLGRDPGARFYHVESAQTARAQNIEVDDLRRSRPNVVIFNDQTFGLPDYDGIWSMERNYIVSQYILDHYVPLLDTHGQLVMLRSDLMKNSRPLPRLSEPPITSDLYFAPAVPMCDWGDVPNFLIHTTSEMVTGSLNLPVTAIATDHVVSVRGWAFDAVANQPVRAVLSVSDGHVVDEIPTGLARADVAAALHTPTAANSGFEGRFEIPAAASFQLYGLNVDGTVSPLSGTGSTTAAAPTITTPDGVVHPLRRAGTEGHLDSITETTWRSYTLTVPRGTNLSSYQWLEMQSRRPLGSSRIQVTDSLAAGTSHLIAWNTLPRTGNETFDRVGSCLQWHGYHTTPLTMLTSGAAQKFAVRLIRGPALTP
jgi:hypothetical protein